MTTERAFEQKTNMGAAFNWAFHEGSLCEGMLREEAPVLTAAPNFHEWDEGDAEVPGLMFLMSGSRKGKEEQGEFGASHTKPIL